MSGPLVLKFGGELIEDPPKLATVVATIRRVVDSGARALVIVHGGGKEIDLALKAAGIEKRQVEGLRITDEATLNVVVAVLAGAVNTRLVAALTATGVQAVGLTGVDGRGPDPAPASNCRWPPVDRGTSACLGEWIRGCRRRRRRRTVPVVASMASAVTARCSTSTLIRCGHMARLGARVWVRA
jgi:acetylglutamate kinase